MKTTKTVTRPGFDYTCECGYYTCTECGHVAYPMEIENGECPECLAAMEFCEHDSARALIEALKQSRPEVNVIVAWEYDEYYTWDGDGPEPEDLIPHNVDVIARTIRGGEMIRGTASLCGCYSEPGGPHDADIDGYFPQMLEEALQELGAQL